MPQDPLATQFQTWNWIFIRINPTECLKIPLQPNFKCASHSHPSHKFNFTNVSISMNSAPNAFTDHDQNTAEPSLYCSFLSLNLFLRSLPVGTWLTWIPDLNPQATHRDFCIGSALCNPKLNSTRVDRSAEVFWWSHPEEISTLLLFLLSRSMQLC